MEQALTPHRAIADRIKAIRQARGMSAQRLAEEMTAAGVPWERPVVTKLETGRRQSISVEELLALAYVLDVAPVDLLVPSNFSSEPYQATPAVTESAEVVREWVRGEAVLPRESPPVGTVAVSMSGPMAQIMRFVEWMPAERGKAVMRRLVMAEQHEWNRAEVRKMSGEPEEHQEGER